MESKFYVVKIGELFVRTSPTGRWQMTSFIQDAFMFQTCQSATLCKQIDFPQFDGLVVPITITLHG